MVSRTAIHRSAAILASAALAVGAAGCGGSDSDGGGGSDAYASTWNDVCQSLTTAQTTLQTEAAAAVKAAGATTPAQIQKASSKPTAKLASSFVAALEKVKDLDAPDEFSAFQKQVASNAPANITNFGKLRDTSASGDVAAFKAAVKGFDPSKVFPALPADLKKQATACGQY